MRRPLGFIFRLSILLVIVAALFKLQTSQTPQNADSKTVQLQTNPCEELMPKTGAVMKSAVAAGVVSDDQNAEKIYVRETAWRNAGQNVRVSIALAAFCIAHLDGRGTSYVRSHETNRILMSVSDGQVSD